MLEHSRFVYDSWLRWGVDSKEAAKICIMGVPFDNAVSLNKGAADAPDMIRQLSVDLSDTTDCWKPISGKLLYDAGDVPVDLNWERYFKRVETAAYELMAADNFCLFMGGDHSVTIPLQKAFGKYQHEKDDGRKIGIIHFDAHYDLCEEYDGHKWSHACTEARALEDVVSGEDLAFVGIRVAEEQELEVLKKNPGITTISAMDVHDKGENHAVEALQSKFEGYDAIYITLDIDVLDPAFAPGTGTPVSGGLTSIQLIHIFKQILGSLPVKVLDIVEIAPDLDVNNITSWAGLKIIHELFSYFSE